MGLRGMKSLRRKVQTMKDDLGDEVADAAREGAQETVTEAKKQVVQHNTVWRTNLYRSLSVEREPTSGVARYRVTADVPYAAFVEFGTGIRGDQTAPPKFDFDAPPLTAGLVTNIVDWVMTKPAFFGPRTEAVGFAIARKIAEEGTYARPFMRPAWFMTKPVIVQNAERAVKKVVRRS